MNKGELIETLAQANEIPVSQSRAYLESLLELIERKIKNGEEVNITGFGKLSVIRRAGRKGRNPATGEAIKVPACKVPKFTAGAGGAGRWGSASCTRGSMRRCGVRNRQGRCKSQDDLSHQISLFRDGRRCRTRCTAVLCVDWRERRGSIGQGEIGE